MNAAATANAASRMITTAAQRGTQRRVNQATTGSRPIAMNSARPIRTRTDRALITSSTSP